MARTASIALLLSLAFFGAWALAPVITQSLPEQQQEQEQARRAAMQLLRENDDAVLLLSDERTYGNLILYAGFDQALYRRVHLCDLAPVRSGGKHGIIFIDWEYSSLMQRFYGKPHCNEALLALAAGQGFDVLMAGGPVHLTAAPDSAPRRAL